MKRRSLGMGLIELLLVLGAIALGSAVVYGSYQFVVSKHREEVALRQAKDTIVRVTTAFMAAPNYQGLTQERAIEDGLFGPEVQVEQGRVVAPWGGELFLSPSTATLANGQTVANGAFTFSLTNVPAALCPQLASALVNVRPSLTINNRPVALDNDGLPSVAGMATACGASNTTSTLVLTFDKANAADGLQECMVPSSNEHRSVPCGDGLAGTREEERQATCPQRYGDVQWSAWQETGNSCSSCPSPETQTVGCGPNEHGQRQQQRSFDCSNNRWNDWTTVSQTCQTCPTDDEERVVACEAGNPGQIIERRSFICVLGQWGPWQVRERQCQR